MLVGHAHYVAVQEFNQEYDRVKEKLEEERRLNVAAHGGWVGGGGGELRQSCELWAGEGGGAVELARCVVLKPCWNDCHFLLCATYTHNISTAQGATWRATRRSMPCGPCSSGCLSRSSCAWRWVEGGR